VHVADPACQRTVQAQRWRSVQSTPIVGTFVDQHSCNL
jgi:hypothetical protein